MSNVYEVQTILDEAVIDNEPHYLIKWKNHSHEDDTWEPISNLGNVIDYLQFWLRKKRELSEGKVKEKKSVAYHNIKPFLYREHLKPPRKTNRQKYAQEILRKKKTWEKYIEKEDKVIDLESSEQGQGQSQEKNHKTLQEKNQVIPAQKPLCKQEEADTNPEKIPKAKQEFKVVGSVDTNQIKRIVKTFVWKDMKCVEVQLIDGRCFNMKEDELKQFQPLLLVDFYERQNIEF